ncbi:4Fe-4S binding protein [Persephonella sp.]
MRVSLNFHNCVHVYFKDSSCDKCINICPVENTIYFENDKIKIDEEKCLSCGACYGICPTEAFSLESFVPLDLLNKMVKNHENLISCKLNVPCIASLDPQYFITLILKLNTDVILDVSYCDTCQIGELISRIAEIAEEVNYFLDSINVEHKVLLQNLNFESHQTEKHNKRREFLKQFSKVSAGLAFWTLVPDLPIEDKGTEESLKNIVEEKVIPEKRKLLLETLKNYNQNFEDKYLEVEKISFTSDKWIDNKLCTNCSICYNICPTGALKPGRDRLQILFEPALCVKCKVCHESCPESCLHMEENLNLEIFTNGMKILAEHVMIPCEECLVPFSYKGDTTICPRCRQLEDEIKDLLQIGD